MRLLSVLPVTAGYLALVRCHSIPRQEEEVSEAAERSVGLAHEHYTLHGSSTKRCDGVLSCAYSRAVRSLHLPRGPKTPKARRTDEPTRTLVSRAAQASLAARETSTTPGYISTGTDLTVSHATIIIAVVVPVVALLLLAAAIWYTYRRKKVNPEALPRAWTPFSPSNPYRNSSGFFFRTRSLRSSTISQTYDTAAPRALIGADVEKLGPVTMPYQTPPVLSRQFSRFSRHSRQSRHSHRSSKYSEGSFTWFPSSPIVVPPTPPPKPVAEATEEEEEQQAQTHGSRPRGNLRNAWGLSSNPLRRTKPFRGREEITNQTRETYQNYTDTSGAGTNFKDASQVNVVPITAPHPATISPLSSAAPRSATPGKSPKQITPATGSTLRYELASPDIGAELRHSNVDMEQPYVPPTGLYQAIVNTNPDQRAQSQSQSAAQTSQDQLSVRSDPTNSSSQPPAELQAPEPAHTNTTAASNSNSSFFSRRRSSRQQGSSSVYSVYIPARHTSRIAQSGLSIRTSQTPPPPSTSRRADGETRPKHGAQPKQ